MYDNPLFTISDYREAFRKRSTTGSLAGRGRKGTKLIKICCGCFDEILRVPFLVELCGSLPAVIQGLRGLGIVAREIGAVVSKIVRRSAGRRVVSIIIISRVLGWLGAAAVCVSH